MTLLRARDLKKRKEEGLAVIDMMMMHRTNGEEEGESVVLSVVKIDE